MQALNARACFNREHFFMNEYEWVVCHACQNLDVCWSHCSFWEYYTGFDQHRLCTDIRDTWLMYSCRFIHMCHACLCVHKYWSQYSFWGNSGFDQPTLCTDIRYTWLISTCGFIHMCHACQYLEASSSQLPMFFQKSPTVMFSQKSHTFCIHTCFNNYHIPGSFDRALLTKYRALSERIWAMGWLWFVGSLKK